MTKKKVTPPTRNPVAQMIEQAATNNLVRHAGQISELFEQVKELDRVNFDHAKRIKELEAAMDEAHEKIYSKDAAEEIEKNTKAVNDWLNIDDVKEDLQDIVEGIMDLKNTNANLVKKIDSITKIIAKYVLGMK